MDEQHESNEQPERKRGLTSITLGWLADRLRKSEKIKQMVESGQYRVDSSAIARSITNSDD